MHTTIQTTAGFIAPKVPPSHRIHFHIQPNQRHASAMDGPGGKAGKEVAPETPEYVEWGHLT